MTNFGWFPAKEPCFGPAIFPIWTKKCQLQAIVESYPDSWDTTYGHMYALFTEERNESIDLDCLLIVLLAYLCFPAFKNDWN